MGRYIKNLLDTSSSSHRILLQYQNGCSSWIKVGGTLWLPLSTYYQNMDEVDSIFRFVNAAFVQCIYLRSSIWNSIYIFVCYERPATTLTNNKMYAAEIYKKNIDRIVIVQLSPHLHHKTINDAKR